MGLLTQEQLTLLAERGRAGNADASLDRQPVVKLYTPAAGATWLIAAIDPDDQDRAWGLCDPGMGTPELGWVSLDALSGLRERFGVEVRRDDDFRPFATLRDYAAVAARLGVIVA